MATESLTCDWSELRCLVNIKYIPDFKDNMKKRNIESYFFILGVEIFGNIFLKRN